MIKICIDLIKWTASELIYGTDEYSNEQTLVWTAGQKNRS